jgi:protein-tyrosine-phosphatase
MSVPTGSLGRGFGIEYPVHVLFLCTGNSARSQIAEALLARKGKDRFMVGSAGSDPAANIRSDAIQALREIGIDWSAKRPKGFNAIVADRWDLVITLCDRTKESCPALPNRPVTAHWGVPDPAEIDDAHKRALAYQNVVSLLSWRIDLMLSLSLDSFESLVLEERLRAIAAIAPPSTQGRPEPR